MSSAPPPLGAPPASARVLHRRDLFPTTLFLERTQGTSGLNAALRDALLREAAQTPGLRKSNVGGWHSAQDLFTRGAPCFRQLTQLVLGGFQEVVAQLRASAGPARSPGLAHSPGPAASAPPLAAPAQVTGIAWAMVMGPGHYSAPHHHGESHFSGVYYVDVGDAPPQSHPAGVLSLLDPRGPRQTEDALGLLQSRHDLRPVDGLLVFFPGWLLHHVHPVGGTRPRVSIAFNLQIVGGGA